MKNKRVLLLTFDYTTADCAPFTVVFFIVASINKKRFIQTIEKRSCSGSYTKSGIIKHVPWQVCMTSCKCSGKII